jgi:hypothetical protein
LIGSIRRRLSRLAGCDRSTPTLREQQLWKRKFAAGDFGCDAPRKVLSIRQTDSRDRFPAHRLRKFLAISGRGKSRRFALTSWWRTQSGETSLRRSNSLLTVKRTGNFAFFRLFPRNRPRKHKWSQMVTGEFPTNRNREIYCSSRELIFANRDSLIRKWRAFREQREGSFRDGPI